MLPAASRDPHAPATGPAYAVRLRGTGVAASCHAHLLGKSGFAVVREATPRPPVPIIMLSDPALALLRGVFGRPDLFARNPRIERRIVSWGGGEAVSVPHGAVAVTGAEIEDALWGQPGPSPDAAGSTGAANGWTIHAAGPFPSGDVRRFGSRMAAACRVDLAPGADRAACVVEATRSGWLFLIPHGAKAAWLLGVGAAAGDLLAESRLVRPLVACAHEESASFDTAPRLLPALCGEDWLACGTSAIAFDPICGDGTAQAAREAILGAAVLSALRDGGDADALRTHYESMMLASMRRHLLHSARFYQSGGTGPWWIRQVTDLVEGHAWCTERLARMPEPRFLLRGFHLVPRGDPA